MPRFILSLIDWMMNLFNPPPLASMSRLQKINRSMLITLALTVNCVFLAMLVALGIYLWEQGQRILRDHAYLVSALGIVFVSVCVNTFCVMVLLHIKRADQKLMEKKPEESTDE